MRSAEGAAGPQSPAGSAGRAAGRPPLLMMAAAAQGAEALGLCVVAGANVIDAASGRSGQSANAIAFIVLELITAAGVAAIAVAMARAAPWSRTPAVMTQVLAAVIAIVLLDAHRLWWGLPTLVLVIAGLVGLFAPTSLRALRRRD